jgi:hypothetical protein
VQTPGSIVQGKTLVLAQTYRRFPLTASRPPVDRVLLADLWRGTLAGKSSSAVDAVAAEPGEGFQQRYLVPCRSSVGLDRLCLPNRQKSQAL